MWRDRVIEIKKEKGLTTREISERSGVSVDTIHRITRRENVDSIRLDTLTDIAERGLGVELWEIFSAPMQSEIAALKEENAKLKDELLALMREMLHKTK